MNILVTNATPPMVRRSTPMASRSIMVTTRTTKAMTVVTPSTCNLEAATAKVVMTILKTTKQINTT